MLRRLYYTTACQFNTKKQGIKLCKMMTPSSKKKWHPSFPEDNTMPSVKSLTKKKHEPNQKVHRRITVLNKLFMKTITDLMSTGTSSIDIVGRGIEISKVKVASDLQRVNVFWVCKGDATDADTETLLNNLAGPLRHELSMLRLMGEVPYIVFVKDKEETRLVELDRRLAMADYGEDFEPTDPGHRLKSEFTLATTLSPEIRAKIKQLEDINPSEDQPIPPMSHNVYGFDHAKVLGRLMAVRKQTHDAWAGYTSQSTVVKYRAPSVAAEGVDVVKQKEELAQFLKKRKLQMDKINKKERDTREPLIHLDNDHQSKMDEPVPDYFEDEQDYEDDDSLYMQDPTHGLKDRRIGDS